MQKQIFILLAVMGLGLTVMTCQAPSNEAAVEGIKNLRKQYMIAQDPGDVEGCVSFWSDDGLLMPPNEPAVAGKDALRSWYRNAFDQFKIDFTVSFDEIEVAGD